VRQTALAARRLCETSSKRRHRPRCYDDGPVEYRSVRTLLARPDSGNSFALSGTEASLYRYIPARDKDVGSSFITGKRDKSTGIQRTGTVVLRSEMENDPVCAGTCRGHAWTDTFGTGWERSGTRGAVGEETQGTSSYRALPPVTLSPLSPH